LAAEIQDKLHTGTELVPSSGGVFEVFLDGKKIFSKKTLGRFPEEGEILGLLSPPA
jgi:selenoprotein W-related protein